jgi:hypothetical protein
VSTSPLFYAMFCLNADLVFAGCLLSVFQWCVPAKLMWGSTATCPDLPAYAHGRHTGDSIPLQLAPWPVQSPSTRLGLGALVIRGRFQCRHRPLGLPVRDQHQLLDYQRNKKLRPHGKARARSGHPTAPSGVTLTSTPTFP